MSEIPPPPLPDSDRPLEHSAPQPTYATPADVRPGPEPDAEIRWWRPGWRDVMRHVGWRWVLLTPAVAMLVIWLLLRRSPFPTWFKVLIQGKVAIFVGAIALTLAAFTARRMVRARREPFCIFCGYDLSGLPDNYRCPECGRPYTWKLIAEYRKDPHWFVERWKAHQGETVKPAAFDAGSVARKRRARDGTE